MAGGDCASVAQSIVESAVCLSQVNARLRFATSALSFSVCLSPRRQNATDIWSARLPCLAAASLVRAENCLHLITTAFWSVCTPAHISERFAHWQLFTITVTIPSNPWLAIYIMLPQ